MKRTKYFMLLFATLFLLTAITVFAINTYNAGGSDKVIPPGWCAVHGEVDRIMIDERLVCFICN